MVLSDPRFILRGRSSTTSPYSYEFLVPYDPVRKGMRLRVTQEAVEWCRERFGYPDLPDHIGRRWKRTSEVEIAFMTEQDAFDFKLRWC